MSDSITYGRKQELCKILASNLATLRTKANMKQDELAERLGLSRQNISAIENGKHEMQWSTFSLLVMFFSKNIELKQIMVAMGIIDSDIERTLDIESSSK